METFHHWKNGSKSLTANRISGSLPSCCQAIDVFNITENIANLLLFTYHQCDSKIFI